MTAVFASITPTRVSRCFHEGIGIRHGNSIVRQIYFSRSVVYIDERTCRVCCERVIFCFEACNTAFRITREALVEHESIVFVSSYV